jgi:hypothetical protein
MADIVVDSAPAAHEDNINYLEIDFDDAADVVVPTDDGVGAGGRGDSSADLAPKDGAAADDFDIQIDEYDVVEAGGKHTVNGGVVPPSDVAQAEPAVSEVNTAEFDIGYEDEEPLDGEDAVHQPEATDQEHFDDENPGHTHDADEIDYDDGDMDKGEQKSDWGDETRVAAELSLQEEVGTTELSSHHALDDTVANTETADEGSKADEGLNRHSREADEQAFDQDAPASLTTGNAGASAAAALATQTSDVLVLYKGTRYELCASVVNDDPETYFFAGNENLYVPLWQFFGRLRDVIKDEIEPSDHLVIKVPQLKLEFGEVCQPNTPPPPDHADTDFLQSTSHEFLDKHTFHDILDLYRRFRYNDGLEDSEQPGLVVRLAAKPDCKERFAMLAAAVDAGRGWSEFFGNSDGSDWAESYHSDPEDVLDGEFPDIGFGDEHIGDDDDDEMQHEVIGLLEEGYFYGDTDDADDHDFEHVADGQEAEETGDRAVTLDNPEKGSELAGKSAETDELDQISDHVEERMGDIEYDAAPPAAHDAAARANDSTAFGDTGDEDLSMTTGPITGDASDAPGGGIVETLNEEAGPASFASNILTSGNAPFSFRTPTQPATKEGSVEGGSERTDTGTLEISDALDDDYDFGEVDGISASSITRLKQASPRCRPSALPSSSGVSHKPVCTYRTGSTYKHPKAGQLARRSIPPCQAAVMMRPQAAVQSDLDHLPARSGSARRSGPRSDFMQHTSANFSVHQDQQESAIQTGTDVDAAFDAFPLHDVGHDDADAAANSNPFDMGGFTTYEEPAKNDPVGADSTIQVPDAHDTSATSTLDGDEITYEDENVAPVDADDGTYETGDGVEGYGDEIDWENDGAEDVAVSGVPTNQPSPSSLSVKRGREEDDLISLDDETGTSI